MNRRSGGYPHRCAADGCDKEVPGDVLMCYPHWRQVPAAQQRRLTRAWQEFRKDPFDQRKRDDYNAARAAAIDAWREAAA